MLEMGVLPEVTAATSATMILFTSVSASVVYISLGAVPFDYGVALAVLGLVCTAVGQGVVLWLAHRHSSRSITVVVMALVMAVSVVILYLEGAAATRHAIHDHTLWDFGTVCTAPST